MVIESWYDIMRLITIISGFTTIGLMLFALSEAFTYRIPPRPVLIVGLSYLLLQGAMIYEIWLRFGADFTWRSPLEGAASVVGAYGWIQMVRYYRPSARQKRHAAISEAAAHKMLAELEARKAAQKAEQASRGEHTPPS